MKGLLVLLTAISVFALSGPAFAGPLIPLDKTQVDKSERDALQCEVRNLFIREKFDKLENMARTLRENKSRFSSGFYKLPTFYNALTSPVTGTEESYQAIFNRMDKWIGKFPDSITARVAEAGAWLDYAWFARGGGYANTVSDGGWRLFKLRVQEASDLLQQQATEDCPERYDYLLLVAQAQGWDRTDYEKVFNAAIAYDPSYEPYYFRKAVYLLPRWFGRDGEWQQFAEDAVQLTPASEGMTMYTRILWCVWSHGEWRSFSGAGISWPKMKQGFRDIQKQYPNSQLNLKCFAKFAAIADTDAASKSFDRIRR